MRVSHKNASTSASVGVSPISFCTSNNQLSTYNNNNSTMVNTTFINSVKKKNNSDYWPLDWPSRAMDQPNQSYRQWTTSMDPTRLHNTTHTHWSMQAHFIILIELTRADEMSGVRRHIAAFVISMDGQIQTHQFHKLLIVSKTQSLFFRIFFFFKK